MAFRGRNTEYSAASSAATAAMSSPATSICREVFAIVNRGRPATLYGVASRASGSQTGSMSVCEKSWPLNNKGRPRTFASA